MAFQRISLKGFDSDFNVRRRVEIYGGTYICWSTLYRGKHLRRKVDELVSRTPLEFGREVALDRTWELRNELIAVHGLESALN